MLLRVAPEEDPIGKCIALNVFIEKENHPSISKVTTLRTEKEKNI
jgi:hypothetical protein